MALFTDEPLILADVQAKVFCLGCGGRYIASVTRCSTCAQSVLIRREEIVRALAASAPSRPHAQLDRATLVRLPSSFTRIELPRLLAGMAAEGLPRLLLDADGAVQGPQGAESPMVVFIDEEDLPVIHDRAAEWLGEVEDAHARPGFADAVELVSADNEIEAQLIAATLEQAGIPHFTKRLAAQLGITFGDPLRTLFFVRSFDQERASAVLDAVETQEQAGAREFAARTEVSAAGGQVPVVEGAPAPAVQEDREGWRELRLERRRRVARGFMVLYALSCVLLGAPLVAGREPGGWLLLLGGVITGLLILWSVRRPKDAFASAIALMAVTSGGGFWLGQPFLFALGIAGVLALWFAYRAERGGDDPAA